MRTAAERAYTWKGQLQVGEDGELVVMQWLRSRGYSVWDERHNKAYQQDDVDLLLLDPEDSEESDTANFIRAEVKTDTYANDYVFFETHTKEHNPGALFKTRARVMYIYKPKRGEIIEVQPARVIAHLYINARQKGGTYYNLYPIFNEKRLVRAFGVKLSYAELINLGGVVHFIPQEEQHDETDSQDPSGIDRSI